VLLNLQDIADHNLIGIPRQLRALKANLLDIGDL